jgi:hypothetical protein
MGTRPDAVVRLRRGIDRRMQPAAPGVRSVQTVLEVTRSSGDVFYLLEDGNLVSAQAMPIP